MSDFSIDDSRHFQSEAYHHHATSYLRHSDHPSLSLAHGFMWAVVCGLAFWAIVGLIFWYL